MTSRNLRYRETFKPVKIFNIFYHYYGQDFRVQLPGINILYSLCSHIYLRLTSHNINKESLRHTSVT